MKSLQVDLGQRSYRVVICQGCLPELGPLIAQVSPVGRIVLVTAAPIHRLYGSTVRKALKNAGLRPQCFMVPDGERAKSLRWASYLHEQLIRAKYERGTTIIALGGGVIGDLTGFVASTYLRGVRFVQIPTTLVAQVDASVGGKTAVNHPRGKNLIGTFYQPALVLADVSVLRTLQMRDLIGGLAEVVKYGVIADERLFRYVEAHAAELLASDLTALERVVVASVRIKAGVVGKDEREAGLRRILNYGHTLGHAIETVTGYGRFHHGEAIAIGMQFAAGLSARLGLCDAALLQRQGQLLRRLGLPTGLPPRLNRGRLMAAMTHDKKVKDRRLHFVLPERIGMVRVEPVDDRVIRKALADFAARPAFSE
jgi:3-dehydroquinate synthase